jgi:hypothetical protein
MRMTQQDWYGYLDYLRNQVQGVDLKNPKNIGEAVNNHNVMQDIDDVVKNKLKKYVKGEKSTTEVKA